MKKPTYEQFCLGIITASVLALIFTLLYWQFNNNSNEAENCQFIQQNYEAIAWPDLCIGVKFIAPEPPKEG